MISLIGQEDNHAEYDCRNGRIQCWLADTARGKVCDFAFLSSSGGKFYKFLLTVALTISPLSVNNWHVRVIWHVRLIGRIQ